ncbi:MAG: tRNA (adenosine(37)-N6)-threonylcarbamoyltransferase complex transferase subunit TsaD [Candidatus Omnitrophica bacterium]|nr:tRNA (adenosine(37)-N6)-threonylcarbamoyltransferase complex transferase subunit TsaD [Candidatus Omnitrophota bacterium]
MNILGIETSCDETAASIVQDGKLILANVIASSLAQHKKYGGIIPEIASRKQLEFINFVIQDALKISGKKLHELDAIAVTSQPGLIGSLLVGICTARGLAYGLQVPLIEVDHVTAHLYANFLSFQNMPHSQPQPKLPAIGLVVSGGHSSIFLVKDFQHIELLGRTRDDAAGEAYDKVARILNLGYPGGPAIDKLSSKGKNQEIIFPGANLTNSYDFSFSGVKTAVYYLAERMKGKSRIPVEKIAYSFQQSVVTSLTKKTIDACLKNEIKTLIIGGGVAANSSLRAELTRQGKNHKINVFVPDLSLCTDNAAMVAGLGFHYVHRKK